MIVPPASEIAAKWVRVTSERTDDYESGVRNPLHDWEKETSDAENRYEAGVKAGILRKAFGKGVKKCGTAVPKAKTILKGIPIWAERVRLAESEMRTGMEPVVRVLEGLKLPQKYETGDPRNCKRVEAVQQALHKLKTG